MAFGGDDWHLPNWRHCCQIQRRNHFNAAQASLCEANIDKTQTDSLNSFIKAIIVFVSPVNLDVSNRIHAGYLSCLRETSKEDEKKHIVEQSFRSCRFFSLAFDTALFGQEHVLSCIVRFTHEERISPFPLFLSVCFASTGEDLATFVFRKLKWTLPFTKWAQFPLMRSNVISQTNGMSSHARRLIQSEYGTHSSNFHQIWCLCHRLHLVIRDLRNVEHIKTVFKFCDRFTSKRKAVMYRKMVETNTLGWILSENPYTVRNTLVFSNDDILAILVQMNILMRFLKTTVIRLVSSTVSGNLKQNIGLRCRSFKTVSFRHTSSLHG